MIKNISFLGLWLLFCFQSIGQIIPQPQKIIKQNGLFFLPDTLRIHSDNSLTKAAQLLKLYLNNKPSVVFKTQEKANFVFKINEKIKQSEGYELHIEKDRITVSSASIKGALHAVQSIRQLLPPNLNQNNSKLESHGIPCQIISDYPQFSYRGMHLDVSRHFYSVEFIKQYIDLLALVKINTFHWHLTDDQGWRIEIKQFPELQRIAAFRTETLVGHYNDRPQQHDNTPYGGFYSQEEIKEIVNFAMERGIDVIPEIEMPGHAMAALAAYPNLGCTGANYQVATTWGVFDDIFCTKPETFSFLEKVLDEVTILFPSKYIHIGGDEAPKTRWKKCAICQKNIKENKLKDESALQSFFIKHIASYLRKKGKKIIGWDEILEGGIAPNATIMSWRGMDGAIEAAKAGHHVIATPNSHCYFDYYQSDNPAEPLAIGGLLPLAKVYAFNPIPQSLNHSEAKYVLGGQGNVWTEYMPKSENVTYMAIPRMFALSEALWTKNDQKSFENFKNKLPFLFQLLDGLNLNYAKRLFDVSGNYTIVDKTIEFMLKTELPSKIYYSTNGDIPSLSSHLYQEPIQIKENTQFIALALDSNGLALGHPYQLNFLKHTALNANISLKPEPNNAYSGSGANGLINGIVGSNTRYGDKEWLGFFGKDVEIALHFSSPKSISSLRTRFFNAPGQWIYPPSKINISFYDISGKIIAVEKPAIIAQNNGPLPVEISNLNFKYIYKITIDISNHGQIADGAQGAGNKAWLFIDEIIVY